MLSADARAAIADHLSHRTADVPEFAFGIVVDGEIHQAEGQDRIFRVASITKSFTAAALVGLVRGLIPGRPIRMDDAVLSWVPELGAVDGSWAEGVTVEDLARMASGLPTDDPWADRQESMSGENFLQLLTRTPIQDFPAGTAYRYSNYGYAMLGLIIERAAGVPFAQLIQQTFLNPLGMESSGFDVRELDADRLVTGFRRTADGQFEPQNISLPGAFSAIGGLASTVRDLSKWVNAHIDALHPPVADSFRAIAAAVGADSEDRARAWKQVFADQQQPVRPMDVTLGTAEGPDGAEYYGLTAGYGLGLRCYFDTRFGNFAGHSGGYPGFGLHMRWHAASRTGVILLTALTGFATETVTAEALEAGLAVERAATPNSSLWPRSEVAAGRGGRVFQVSPIEECEPSERAYELARIAEHMIATGDDSQADSVFSMNMDLDVPRPERQSAWAAAREHTGEHGQVSTQPKFSGASSAVWTVVGNSGKRTVTMTLNPFEEIQSLRISLD